jgi:hypothetical protein
MRRINTEIDDIITLQLHTQPAHSRLNRQWFIMLPHRLSTEIMASWLRNHEVRIFDKKLIERLTVLAKTLKRGQQADVNRDWVLKVGTNNLALVPHER